MERQIYQQMRRVEDRHWWFVGRRRIVAAVIQSLSLPQPARILDAGCGTGGSLALLRRYGRVEGLEMDTMARELANERQLGEILPGHLPDALPFAEQSFDLIVLLDVLEHTADDAASLAALARLLKPGGSIVLTVPAFAFLWGPHDRAHHHRRRYRAATLQATAQRAGLELSYLSYFNSWLFPLITPIRLLQRLLPSLEGGLDLPPAPINVLLTRLFSSEGWFIPRWRLPFGVSLLAVLQSPSQ